MTKPRLYQSVAQRIVEYIAERDLKNGAILPNERVLAHHLGVSRSTIREAEIALQVAGFISIRPGHGVTVCQPFPPTPEALSFDELQLLEALLAILGEVASLASLTASPEQFDALEQSGRTIGDVHQSLTLEAEVQFYLSLAALIGNAAVLHSCEELLRSYTAQTSALFMEDDEIARHLALCKTGIGTVLASIRTGARSTRSAMRAHFRALIALRLDMLEQRALAEIAAQGHQRRERFARQIG